MSFNAIHKQIWDKCIILGFRHKSIDLVPTSDDDNMQHVVTDNIRLFVLTVSCLFLIIVTISQCKWELLTHPSGVWVKVTFLSLSCKSHAKPLRQIANLKYVTLNLHSKYLCQPIRTDTFRYICSLLTIRWLWAKLYIQLIFGKVSLHLELSSKSNAMQSIDTRHFKVTATSLILMSSNIYLCKSYASVVPTVFLCTSLSDLSC